MSTDSIINERKSEALAELEAYRERLRQAKETDEASSAEARMERALQAARAEQEREEQWRRDRAEGARIMREHQAKLDAASQEYRDGLKAGNRVAGWVRPPEYEIARLLRERIGDEAVTIVAKLQNLSVKQLAIQLSRLPHDERAAELAREREALATGLAEAAKTLPQPEDDQEAAILSSYGFTREAAQRS